MAAPDNASVLAIEALNGARRWVQSRIALRRALDSKAAPPQKVEKAKAEYNKSAEELEALIIRLERYLQNTGRKVPLKRNAATPFPWRELFGMVAAGAKAVETALDGTPTKMPPGKTVVIDATKVIDVEPEP